MPGGEVAKRSGNHAEVDDRAAGSAETANQGGGKCGTFQPAVASYEAVCLSLFPQLATDGPANQAGSIQGETLVYTTTDIVSPEQVGTEGLSSQCGFS
jgi:hypothetical protein